MSLWKLLAAYAVFETERLWLRPLSFDDREVFYQMVSDREHLSVVFPYQASQAESDELLTQAFLRQPLGHWGLVDKDSKRLVGVIRLEQIQETQARAEVGYFINQAYAGRGLMTEALQNIAFLATELCAFRELTVITHAENKASQRVAQKAGFELVKQYKGSDRHSHKTRQYIAYCYSKRK